MSDINGFSNKEILILINDKFDRVIEDHEARIRILEAEKNETKGEKAYKRYLTPVAVGLVGAFWWLPSYIR